MTCNQCNHSLETQEEREKGLCANCSQTYPCPICGKEYGTEHGLKIHMGFHDSGWVDEKGEMGGWKKARE